jgi:peptidoglycan/LPS O-acetylase OafA/YrhL
MGDAVAVATRRDAAASEPPRRLGHRAGLDGLRAIAVAFVLLHHTIDMLVPRWEGWFRGGFLGVDLFFVLSGFLITTLLLERREQDETHPLRSFYARRALRLLPAVAALLVVNLVLAFVEGDDIGQAVGSFAIVFSYTTNWAMLYGWGELSPHLTHLWSLAIEEQFYALWPLLLLGGLWARLTRSRLAVLCLVLALVAAVWRFMLYEGGEVWLAIYIRTDARADALLIGAALALLRPDILLARVPQQARNVLGWTAFIFFVFVACRVNGDSASLYRGGYTVVALVTGVLIAVELGGPWSLHRMLSSRPMVIGGKLSYGLYLWHFLVFQVVARHVAESSTFARITLGWFITLGVAALSYRFVELPALRVKAHIGRARRAPMTV